MGNPFEIPSQPAATPDEPEREARQETQPSPELLQANLREALQHVEGAERGKALTLVEREDLDAHPEWAQSLASSAFSLQETEQAGLVRAEDAERYRALVRENKGWWDNAERDDPDLMRRVREAAADVKYTYLPMVVNGYLSLDEMRAILRNHAQGSRDGVVNEVERRAYEKTWNDAIETFRDGYGRQDGVVYGGLDTGARSENEAKLKEMESDRNDQARTEKYGLGPRLANMRPVRGNFTTYRLLREKGVITDREMWGGLRGAGLGHIPVPEYIQVRSEADKYYRDDVVGRVSKTEISGDDRVRVWEAVKTTEKLKFGLAMGVITQEQFERGLAALRAR